MSEITQTAPVRERSGKIASAVGIVLNFLLAASKMAVGFFTGLVSVFADGVNNLSDCGSSVISLVSFRIASKPADKEHPYGHQRAEYVAAMVISLIVFLLAFELLRESVSKIVQGSLPAVAPAAVAVLCVSFFVKGGMFFYYRSVGKKIRSDVLKAAAVDSACDCLATAAVLIGLAVAEFASLPADGYAGVIVASLAAPVVNTGLFILGSLLMSGTLRANFVGEGDSVLYFLVIGCAGLNFIFEFVINAVASPAICRVSEIVLRTRRRRAARREESAAAVAEHAENAENLSAAPADVRPGKREEIFHI